ncbi:MAG: ABC transporter ATP-binding protein [Clostridia bacterium]|nr:ABC transporter ATP-binding protein [Clostridia bacterium]
MTTEQDKIQAAAEQGAQGGAEENGTDNLLVVKNLVKYFPIKSGFLRRTVGNVRAVDGISFSIPRGTTMGLVGESGCGKSTAGRTILRLQDKTSGEVYFDGVDIFSLSKKELRKMRPKVQIIFQDPYSSLSPRLPIGEIIGEAVREHKVVPPEEHDAYVTRIMHACGLEEYHKDRYPHEFSGGQRQRICIARALALNPDFILCDEPVSALDVSIQAQIINQLRELQKEFNLTYLFISHDLSVVEHISDSVGVMYLGNLVETGPTDKIYSRPLHPNTKALFSAVPVPDPDYQMDRIVLEGSIPSPANPPSGCKFHTRCKDCMEICRYCAPATKEVEEGHFCACHLYNTVDENVAYEAEAKRIAEEQRQAKEAYDAMTPFQRKMDGVKKYFASLGASIKGLFSKKKD